MAPFDRFGTTFYWSAIVNILVRAMHTRRTVTKLGLISPAVFNASVSVDCLLMNKHILMYKTACHSDSRWLLPPPRRRLYDYRRRLSVIL